MSFVIILLRVCLNSNLLRETFKLASRLTLEEIKKKAVPILQRNDVVKAAVFGSTAWSTEHQKIEINLCP
ncbi:MAG: hypothetical protein HQK59_15300 [Deltaproteobacteria bacterium]|nr:hypothetical protein [Deltaproteobacteria bacterium]